MDAQSVRSHLARIERDGYTIVEDAFEPARADALREDLLRLERELGIAPSSNDFEGRKTWRIYNLLVHGPLYEAIPVDPNVLPIVEGVLDDGLRRLSESGWTARGEVVTGEAIDEITKYARKIGADLVVVGHKHLDSWAARWWRGSISGALIEHAPCSVLVVIIH